MNIIAVVNQKGGVGKTTTSINLTASLAHGRKRVLLIDADPQGNATMGCGINKYETKKTMNEVLLDEIKIEQAIVPVFSNQFAVLPSNANLTAAEVLLLNQPNKEFKLKNALATLSSHFDFVIIDCPPTLNMLTINALVAATHVLIPMQCEYYALEGLSALMQSIERIKQSFNPSLAIEGLLCTLFDSRSRLTQDVAQELENHFSDLVFKTKIVRNIRLAEAPSHGMPILYYDKRSKGALCYLQLAAEILRKHHQSIPPSLEIETTYEQS